MTTGVAASPLPNALAAIDQNPTIDPPKSVTSLGGAANWFLSKAWSNRETILTTLGKGIMGLLAEPPTLVTDVMIKSEFLYECRRAIATLEALAKIDPQVDYSAMKQRLQEQYTIAAKYPDRLVPMSTLRKAHTLGGYSPRQPQASMR